MAAKYQKKYSLRIPTVIAQLARTAARWLCHVNTVWRRERRSGEDGIFNMIVV